MGPCGLVISYIFFIAKRQSKWFFLTKGEPISGWSGGTYESLEERWQGGWTIEKNAYAVGKVECEKMTYAWGDKTVVPF